MRPNVALTLKSSNAKTGPIPVSTTESKTCPNACPLKAGGCYAKGGPLWLYWQKVDQGKAGIPWEEFLELIKGLPGGTLWRHNQAGDLPGEGDFIDVPALEELTQANKGKRGFTYTHKPPVMGSNATNAVAIAKANEAGFTVNLSANDLEHADKLAALGIGPVVTLLPAEQMTNTQTPEGRKVVICPAITHEKVTCQTCGLCSRGDRPTIVGFPAHGASKRKASDIAKGPVLV